MSEQQEPNGRSKANAIVCHPGGENAPQLANVEGGCQEIA